MNNYTISGSPHVHGGESTKKIMYSVIIAFAFSVVVGVVFGYLPAKNAANLKPVDSIRYE